VSTNNLLEMKRTRRALGSDETLPDTVEGGPLPTLWETFEFPVDRLTGGQGKAARLPFSVSTTVPGTADGYAIELDGGAWWGVTADEWADVDVSAFSEMSSREIFRQLHLAFLGRRGPVQVEIYQSGDVIGSLTVTMYAGKAEINIHICTYSIEEPEMRKLLKLGPTEDEHIFLPSKSWTVLAPENSFIGLMKEIEGFWKKEFGNYEHRMNALWGQMDLFREEDYPS